jgi:hypothetical protein
VGVPEYYEWRSRSGCFFCFFQRREEWLGLAERQPKEFARAVEMQKQEGGKGYNQNQVFLFSYLGKSLIYPKKCKFQAIPRLCR